MASKTSGPCPGRPRAAVGRVVRASHGPHGPARRARRSRTSRRGSPARATAARSTETVRDVEMGWIEDAKTKKSERNDENADATRSVEVARKHVVGAARSLGRLEASVSRSLSVEDL